MARNRTSSTGCAPVLLSPLWIGPLFMVSWLAAPVLAAPGEMLYLFSHHPRQFHRESVEWWITLAAAPLLALKLATVSGRRFGPAGLRDLLAKANWCSDLLTKADRRSIRVRRAGKAAVLLAVMSAISWVVLAHGYRLTGPRTMTYLEILDVWAVLAALAAFAAFRAWDHWYPPLGEPVTADTVRAVAARAKRELQQLRSGNAEVERLAREIEEQLSRAWSEVEFASLRNKHYESFSCADIVHGHYLSALSSGRAMSVILLRGRASRMPRPVPLRDPHTGRRSRPDRAGLTAACTDLSEYRHAIAAEAKRSLTSVRTLNQRTATFRDSIRDRCGGPGQRWYSALEDRKRQSRPGRRRLHDAGW